MELVIVGFWTGLGIAGAFVAVGVAVGVILVLLQRNPYIDILPF